MANEQKALKTVQDFIRKSQQFRKNYEAMWVRYLGEYLNSRSVKSNSLQRANLKLPYAFTIIENLIPQLIDVFLSEKPYISYEGVGMEDEESAEQLSSFATYQLDRMKFFKQLVPFLKNMFIYGTAIAKTPWVTNTKNINQTIKSFDNDGIPEFKKIPRIEVEFDGPRFENIDIFDFFPDPGCNQPGDIQSMSGCVYRVFRTFDQIKKLEKKDGRGIYTNLDELKRSVYGIDGDSGSTNAWLNMTKADDSWYMQQKESLNRQEPGTKNAGKIELWEYWGLYGEGEEKTEYVITIANGDTIIRCQENPYDYKFKPFVACVDYVVPGEFYGLGEIEVIYSLIKEATSLRNARLDQANLAVNKMWIVDRNAGINIRNLYSRSGGIVLTNDMNGIRELPAPDVSISSYKEVPAIEYDMQNATSQINAAQASTGIGRAFASTSKGVQFVESYTSNRVKMKARQIESWLMEEYGKILLMLNRQFVRQDQWVRIFNNEDNPYIKISPDIFWKDYDFKPVAAMERLNKQQRQYNLQNNIIPFLRTVEQSQPYSIRMDNLVKRYFREFDYRNVNELVNSQEEREKLIQQSQQAQQKNVLEQIELEKNKEMELQAQEIQGKLARDQVSAETKSGITVSKGLFELAAKGVEGIGRLKSTDSE